MKRLIQAFSTFVIIFLFPVLVFSQTNISGTINGDSTKVWALANSPYIITGSTTISTADTVLIEDGVEVRFEPGVQLTVSGGLIANGATFTSNSGSSRNSWSRIYFNTVGSYGSFKNSTIQFADHAIDVVYGLVRLDTVTISDSNQGLYISSKSAKVELNAVTINNTANPIYYYRGGSVTYSGTNDFTGNDQDAVYVAFSNSEDNWILPNPGVPYYFPNDLKVQSTDTLTIESSSILKFYSSRTLYVYDGGVIHAVANPDEDILFTSYKNDNAGGDTNGDGTASAPENRDWYGIRIEGQTSSASSRLKHIEVSFAGYEYSGSHDYRGGLTIVNSSPLVDSSLFVNNYYGVVIMNGASPTFTNNEIGSSGVVPVALTFDATPVFTNNSFSSSNNQYDAIGLIGTTITGANTLPKRDFTSIPNVTYLLLTNLYVATGATLTIDPGVVIKSLGAGVQVKGILNSIATSGEKIVYTSVKDDNVGNPKDTNKDGNNTVPANTDWRGIAFGEDAGASVMDYNIVRYARYNAAFYYDDANHYIYPTGAVNVMNGDVTISNTEIANTQNYAIDSWGTAQPTITNNSFSNTGSVPVALSLTSDPTFSGNTLANVGLIAIGYHGETITVDGIIRNRDFAGYDDITTVLLGTSTIASGSTLTIEPGTVIKVANSTNYLLYVEGALKAEGKVDSTIYFTSIYDDQVGNPLDTNGDGGATTPAPDNWGAIRFKSTTDDANSAITHTEIRYSKHGIIFTNAAPTVDNVTVLSCLYMGLGIESGSDVHISNATIQNCGYDPVAISTTSNPTFSNITFNSNGSNGIGLLEAQPVMDSYYANRFNYGNYYFDTRNTITSNTTITPYAFAGYSNLPFILRSTWYVGEGTVLSVSPSVIFKGNVYLYVDGALRVLGTVSEPVIFTSNNDDSAGGDTNNDGNISVPAPGQSLQINFRSSSIDSASLVKHAEFRYPSTAIEFESSKAVIDSSLFQLSNSDAIHIYGNSAPTITNNQFQNIRGPYYKVHSIYMDMFSSPVFFGNTESNVDVKGLGIRNGTWGSDATIPFRSFAGTDSITYVMHGKFIIPAGSKIIIPAGMVFKAYTNSGTGYRDGSTGFDVQGALKIQGTADHPVIFTNDSDDRFGQPADLYTDGQIDDEAFRSGTPWITYSATSNDTSNIIDYAVFKYKNVAVVANSANPAIRHSVFEKDNYGIQMTGVSAPFVEYNSFNDLNKTPMLLSLVSYPQSTVGNSMGGTTWKGIGVQTETLVQDVTLPRRNFGGKTGIPYVFTGDYTIGTGAVLTIDPGVIIKMDGYYNRIRVQKGLIAKGGASPDSFIIFTDINDDFYGGDTNADSSASLPGSWGGIYYEGTSLDGSSVLDHVVLKDVKYSTYAAVYADNSSPTITHSSIFDNEYGVRIKGSGNPVLTHNDIYNNTSYGVFNQDKTFEVDATNNWWGNDSGPTHSGNIGGTGDVVSDGVNYNPFVGGGASNPILGDVSLNGKVQSYDASILLRSVALIDSLTDIQKVVADVSGNGDVSAMDASYVLQYVVGLIEAFPAELASKVRATTLAKNKVENTHLRVGEKDEANGLINVSLEISDISNAYAIEIGLQYNPDNIELVGITGSKALSVLSFVANTAQKGKAYVAIASSEAISSDNESVMLTFKSVNDAGNEPGIEFTKFVVNESNLLSNAVSNEKMTETLPDKFELQQNYPNPFNPSTLISYSIPNNQVMVRLEIYNILGQKVKTLVNDVRSAGRYSARWNGTNEAGMQVSTGVYIYRLQAGGVVQSKKLTFIK